MSVIATERNRKKKEGKGDDFGPMELSAKVAELLREESEKRGPRIVLECVTVRPFIDLGGYGRFVKGDKRDFPANIANQLVNDREKGWKKTEVEDGAM